MARTMLVVGGGPGLRRAVDHGHALGLDIVAASPAGETLDEADASGDGDGAESDPLAIARLAERHRAAGLLAASRDALEATAAAAASLGLQATSATTAHAVSSRIALRRQLGLAGVAQPRFAAVRTVHEGHAGLETVGLPAILAPAAPDPGASARLLESPDDLDATLYRALAASPTGEAIVESFHPGHRVEVACLVRGREVRTIAVVDRPAADASTRVYPSTRFGDVLASVEQAARHALHALELEDGVALVQVLAAAGEPLVLDVAAWTPDEPIDALVRHAVGVDLLELAIRIALRADVPDGLARPRFHRSAALRRLADRAPNAPAGAVEHGPGYVVVEAATNLEALERASAAP